MITAVDANVLLDVLQADAEFGSRSKRAILAAGARGTVVACDVVWGEVFSAFAETATGRSALARLSVDFSPLTAASAERAGRTRRAYQRAGGTRQRMVPDFLIGAHAYEQADALLTRDRGFTRSYFEGLTIIDPSAEA